VKTLLITGGTGGLGRDVVPILAREYRCLVVHRQPDSLESFAAIENVTPIDSLERAAKFAPLRGIVALAGAFSAGSSSDVTSAMIEANLFSFVRAVEAGLPHLADDGRIVAISSAASLHAPSGLAAYSASKAALNTFVRTLAADLKPRRITANAILPTSLATPPMIASGATGLVPTANVAACILYLLGEAASSVTGQWIEMSA